MVILYDLSQTSYNMDSWISQMQKEAPSNMSAGIVCVCAWSEPIVTIHLLYYTLNLISLAWPD